MREYDRISLRHTGRSLEKESIQMTDVEYFRPSDIAELMRWSESHLANLRCHNEGPPFIKVRKRVLYSKVDFYRWL